MVSKSTEVTETPQYALELRVLGNTTLYRYIVGLGAVLFFSVLLYVSFALRPPTEFPIGQRIEIPFGTSLLQSVRILKQEHVVRSALLLQTILITRLAESEIQAGTYQFDEPLSVFEVARAITHGTHGIPLLRITIPEGLRNTQIDAIVDEQLPAVEPGMFALAAEGREGFLFPETYHVPEAFTAEQFVALMEDMFKEKIVSLQESFMTSSRTREDVIIMASLIEREANSEESMKIVSGILWKRLDQEMPLQVDASFDYLLNKTSREVTLDDLKIDSPYNTYKYKGLPPTPLNNPGLQAITAALSPTPSPYLYYLTAPDGTFHYAQTFKEHTENKELYLD